MKKISVYVFSLFCISDAYAQQNPIGNIIGGMLGAAIIQGVKTEWEKLPQLEQYCVNVGLQRDGTNINQLIQNGVGPSDQRLSPLLNGCRQFISRELKSNIQCQLNFNNRIYSSFCDEGYAENNGSSINRLSLEQAIEYSFSNRTVQVGQFERTDAANRRQQMINSGRLDTRVIAPSFDCMRAKSQTEISICNSFELTELDNELGGLWNQLKILDKKGEYKKQLNNFNRIATSCKGEYNCIKRSEINSIDYLANQLKLNGVQVFGYSERLEKLRKDEEEKRQAEILMKKEAEQKILANNIDRPKAEGFDNSETMKQYADFVKKRTSIRDDLINSISSKLPQCEGNLSALWDSCHGTVTNRRNVKRIGDWYNGYLNGPGVEILANGDVYIGNFTNGQADGSGAVFQHDNKMFIGDFIDGSAVGYHIVSWPSGEVYIGYVRDYKLHGIGTKFNQDGSIQKSGFWEYDNFKGKETQQEIDSLLKDARERRELATYVNDFLTNNFNDIKQGTNNVVDIMSVCAADFKFEGDLYSDAKDVDQRNNSIQNLKIATSYIMAINDLAIDAGRQVVDVQKQLSENYNKIENLRKKVMEKHTYHEFENIENKLVKKCGRIENENTLIGKKVEQYENAPTNQYAKATINKVRKIIFSCNDKMGTGVVDSIFNELSSAYIEKDNRFSYEMTTSPYNNYCSFSDVLLGKDFSMDGAEIIGNSGSDGKWLYYRIKKSSLYFLIAEQMGL